MNLQLNYCKSWESLIDEQQQQQNRNTFATNDPYIKSIYQSFHEKLLNQIEFTKLTIILHIADRLIIPSMSVLNYVIKVKVIQLMLINLWN